MSDILARIDAAIAPVCARCGTDIPDDSPSTDFCSERCQWAWHARRVDPLGGYLEYDLGRPSMPSPQQPLPWPHPTLSTLPVGGVGGTWTIMAACPLCQYHVFAVERSPLPATHYCGTGDDIHLVAWGEDGSATAIGLDLPREPLWSSLKESRMPRMQRVASPPPCVGWRRNRG